MMLSRDIKVTRGSILEEVLQVYKESEDVVEDHLYKFASLARTKQIPVV